MSGAAAADWTPVAVPVAVAHEAGVSYRQIDYWTRRGWLRPGRRDDGLRSGYARIWDDTERRVARIMGRLVRAGVGPEVAAGIARTGSAAGEDDPWTICEVTADVTILVSNE